MAKFLTTVGNSFYIEQIIINATETLTLVTPYLKLSRNLIERLSDAEKNGVRITLIYGKNELAAKEKNTIFSFNNIRIYFCENLHAKCYHNESSMIITSMNLYEFSERNNREMGLLIEIDTDKNIFGDTIKEIESIKNSSKLEKDFVENNILQSETSPKLELHPDYSKPWDFHLPELQKTLEKKYPDRSIELKDYISVKDFPSTSITLEVTGRIDFKFENEALYDRVKRLNKEVINQYLPGIRFYWNSNQLNIYPEQEFNVELDSNGLMKKVEKFALIIKTVSTKLILE